MNDTIKQNYIKAYYNMGLYTVECLYLLNDYNCFLTVYNAYYTLISSKIENINGVLVRSVGVISPRYNNTLKQLIKDYGGVCVGETSTHN